jgi:hypothetical protein
VAEFVRRSEAVDWDALVSRARALGCRRTLLFGLAVSRPMLDGVLPARVEQELENEPQVDRLASRVWAWLASDAPVSPSFTERTHIDLTLIDGGAGKWSYGIRRLLTPTKKDWSGRSLPRPLAFLYVPLRFTRLARQYLPRPWRLRRLLRPSTPPEGKGPGL